MPFVAQNGLQRPMTSINHLRTPKHCTDPRIGEDCMDSHEATAVQETDPDNMDNLDVLRKFGAFDDRVCLKHRWQ